MSARARRAATVVGLFVVVGALAGAAWELVWTPPLGVAVDDAFSLTSDGLARAFDGTALYVLIAAGAGLVLGALVALRAGGSELSALAALVVGSLAAAAVMAWVGMALGPPDADATARGLENFTPVEQDLRIEGLGAYLAFPSGALLGAGGVFLALARRRSAGGDPRRRFGEDSVEAVGGGAGQG